MVSDIFAIEAGFPGVFAEEFAVFPSQFVQAGVPPEIARAMGTAQAVEILMDGIGQGGSAAIGDRCAACFAGGGAGRKHPNPRIVSGVNVGIARFVFIVQGVGGVQGIWEGL